MKKSLVILGVLFSVVSSSAQQVAKGLTAANGQFIGFYEYKPGDYNTGTKYPVIIFLHGIGERGNGTSELSRVLGNGTPNNIQNGHTMRFMWNGKWETFLVLTPQLSNNYGDWQNFYVEEMIKYATNNLSIDPNRIFLTGLSLGGGGVWKYAAGSLANAQKLAAIGVSCGTCENANWANIANANLPTWAWHAADDGTVGAGCSNGAVSTINSYNPAVKPYLTIWPTGQHWIWTKVYNTDYDAQHPNIYEWFLGQNKSLPVNKRPTANAGADQTISSLVGIATLNGGSSRDEDGNIVRYVWKKVSGPSFGTISAQVSVGSSTTVIGLNNPGVYVYELRVLDNRADWSVDQVTINVVPQVIPEPIGNKNPVANAGTDVSINLPTNSANLNGGGSSDPDGSVTSYAWSKVAGPSQFTLNNAGAATASVTNLAQGTYTFRLIVKDNNNATNSDDVNITVNASGSTPGKKVADAGTDVTIALPTNSATLNGSGSTDPGGAIKEYKWEKIAGPAQYAISNPKIASPSLTNLAQGVYQLKLTVWDHNWVPSSDTAVVTVNTGSSNPGTGKVANAGADFAVTLPNSGTLNGTASSDPGGAIKEFKWERESGPTQFTIQNPKSPSTSLSNLVAGTYQFKLTVWNHQWVPSSDFVTVTVTGSGSGGGGGLPNPGRIPQAGPDITITLPTNNTTLDASASKDPGGAIKEFKWEKISGPSQYAIADPKAAKTALNNLAQGTYAFRLTTWGYNWVPNSDTVIVNVLAGSGSGGGGVPGRIPNAGADIYITLPTNSTTLNGSASANPNGVIKEYQWTRVSGPAQHSIASPKSVNTTVSNLVQGVYQFKLTVWDHNWVPSSDTVDVVVRGSGSPDPNRWAYAGQDIYLTLPINSTTLNGSGSVDPAGGILKGYQWRRIGGPTQYSITSPKSVTTTLTNLIAGNYAFELMVWNKDWVPRADTINVFVMQGGSASSAAIGTTETVMSAKTSGATETTIDKLTVYPNPAHGMINVQMVSAEAGKTIINVYDVAGRNVQQLSFEKAQSLQQRSLNVTRLAPGVYHVEVIINNKKKMITKFIKQ